MVQKFVSLDSLVRSMLLANGHRYVSIPINVVSEIVLGVPPDHGPAADKTSPVPKPRPVTARALCDLAKNSCRTSC
jgi:hypothetical protein